MRVLAILPVVVAASMIAFMGSEVAMKESEDLVSFCSPDVSPTLVTGRANFTIIYQLDLDDSGHPVRTQPLKQIDGVGDMSECLMDWRLPSFAHDRQLKVVLSWEHARGWTKLRLAAANRSLVVRVPGDLSPYGRCAQ